ncbi:MAG TPA: hypothetical protein VET88_05195 [Gammaproteobacteria bacterium]|nr:hypothetical protein [Gammaproteobacteria bacterium]
MSIQELVVPGFLHLIQQNTRMAVFAGVILVVCGLLHCHRHIRIACGHANSSGKDMGLDVAERHCYATLGPVDPGSVPGVWGVGVLFGIKLLMSRRVLGGIAGAVRKVPETTCKYRRYPRQGVIVNAWL